MAAAPATALIHFSGGSDSTLAAALFAQRFDKVHLITYDRFSFIGAVDYTAVNYKRLCAAYGDERFERVVLPLGRWHKEICYERYAYFARKYKLAVTALAFCKLAMHWRSAVYCLERGIKTVGDGAVPYMNAYPDQNKRIALESLERFYRSFGLAYENPVYDMAESVEERLYDLGVTETPRMRGTAQDKQVYYVEQVLFALFLKYYVDAHGWDAYEAVLRELFAEKIDFMRGAVERWLASAQGLPARTMSR